MPVLLKLVVRIVCFVETQDFEISLSCSYVINQLTSGGCILISQVLSVHAIASSVVSHFVFFRLPKIVWDLLAPSE